MIVGPLLAILVFAVALSVIFAQWLGGRVTGTNHPSRRPAPLDVFQDRLARGEIDKDEVEERSRPPRE
ncbi:hypothetical protein N183_28185 [Sinorhizobium sp. Sb3]|nr:hypothetical protein N183_28185 [Sinorhizobium sp. Sb3]